MLVPIILTLFRLKENDLTQADTGTKQAPTGTTPAAAEGPMGNLTSMVLMLSVCFFIIYFMMIRPQKKQQRERDDMLKAIRKNDEVITSSGIIGIVTRYKDKEPDVTLLIDAKSGTQVRFLKSAVVQVRKKGDEPDEDEKPAEAPAPESKEAKQE